MKIKVWDNGGATADRYTVVVGKAVFDLSADCDMPNGVCQYVDDLNNLRPLAEFAGKEVRDFYGLPMNVRKQISKIVAEVKNWKD